MQKARDQKTGRQGSAATLERILNSAEAEFAEKGLISGRIQEIAQVAGVSKQLIYHYFPTKEDLYQTLLERISNRYDALFQHDDYDRLPPDEALRLFVSRHFCAHARNGGNLLHDVAHHSNDVLRSSRRRHELVRIVSACLDRIVRRGREQGLFTTRVETPVLLLMINFITNSAVSTGEYLIGLMRPELPSCPGGNALETLCADFILRALTSQVANASPVPILAEFESAD